MMSVSSSGSASATAGYGRDRNSIIAVNGNLELFSVVDGMVTKPIGNFQPLDFDSDFGQKIIEGFNSFTGEAREVIIQQLEGLRAACASKGVKLLLGEEKNMPICIFKDDVILKQDKYICINISESLVKRAMKNNIYIIKQEGDNIPEIKAVPLGNLVAGQEEGYINLDDPDLIAKCAAYLLAHEFFHANTQLTFSNRIKGGLAQTPELSRIGDKNKFVEDHILENCPSKTIKILMGTGNRGDDFRNVTNVTRIGEKRVPGEFELLSALHPGKLIMRLYEGKALDFSKKEVLNACLSVFNAIFK